MEVQVDVAKGAQSAFFRKEVSLKWANVSYDVEIRERKVLPGGPVRQLELLHPMTGSIEPGEFCAILGPSGAGKSTFMDVLCDRKTTGHVNGEILINGKARDPTFKQLSNYIPQEDAMMPTETVYETLRFYADMKLPRDFTDEQKEERIAKIMKEMGLAHRKDTKVGGILPGGIEIRGLSGGEKRRLSIGCGLITSPSIVFLDEPTSGLDATNAKIVMEKLRDLTKKDPKVTVICSIHQPRPEIWKMFGSIVLLTDGYLVYKGKEPAKFMIDNGFKVEDESGNPADFVMDCLVSIKGTSRVEELADKFAEIQKSARTKSSRSLTYVRKAGDPNRFNIPWVKQFIYLASRSGRDFARNPGAAGIRLVASIVMGLIYSTLFAGLGNTQDDVNFRYGLLFFLLTGAVLAPFPSVSLFLNKRDLFNREQAQELYHPSVYMIVTVMYESLVGVLACSLTCVITYWICNLNAGADRFFFFIFMDVLCHLDANMMIIFLANALLKSDLVFSLGASIIVIWMLFAGFFVTVSQMPSSFSWVRYLDVLFYGLRACVVNEFDGSEFTCDTIYYCPFPTPDAIFEKYSLVDHNKNEDIGILLTFFVGFSGMAYYAMVYMHKGKTN